MLIRLAISGKFSDINRANIVYIKPLTVELNVAATLVVKSIYIAYNRIRARGSIEAITLSLLLAYSFIYKS